MESKTRSMPSTEGLPPLPGQEPAVPALEPVPPAPPDLAPQAGESAPKPLIAAVSPIVTIPALPEAVAEPPKPLCDWWGKPITPGPLAGRSYPGIDPAWDGYEDETAWYEASIASLKHQLRNSEQAVSFAASLVSKAEKADPKALPRPTNETRKLRKQIDLARSFLCAADVPPLPLEDQCKWIGARLTTERHARVQAEGKLQAAEQALDDLRKAADSPAAQ